MKISDIAELMDSLSKLNPAQIAEEARNATAPIMQLLSGIQHSLDELNANLTKLIEQNEKRDKDAGH